MTNEPAPWGVEGAEPDMPLADAVTIEDIRAAADRVTGIADRTPVLSFPRLDVLAGARVVLKCENFQPIGAFKIRGAVNAMKRLDEAARGRGVITYSSGNHAQAVALAAGRLGVPAVIVMPRDAPRVKMNATRRLLEKAPPGSGIIEYDPAEQSREVLGRQIAGERGLHLIPPYDHPDVIAGQGTAALELLEEAGPLDALYVPCGGGGLLSGSAVAAEGLCPGCRMVGVEPAAADDAKRSFDSGRLCTVRNPPTIADGARTPFLGRYTFPIVRAHVDEMITVSEAEIARATLVSYESLRLVVEPSGALGLAGAMKHARVSGAGRVGVVLSGGNMDPGLIGELRRLAEGGGGGE